MTGYIELLNLTISHPYIDAGSWSMAPGARAERFLALSGLKAAFSRGRLSLRGPADFPNLLDDGGWPASDNRRENVCFFFFCGDPYLIRASDWPSYQPGRQLLFFQLDGQQTEFGWPQVIDFPADLAAEVNRSRKKYQGQAFGPPPFGLICLPPVRRPTEAPADGVVKPLSLSLLIAPRAVFWIYKVVPRLEASLALVGGPARFKMREADDALLFVSENPVVLNPAGVRGASLMVVDPASAENLFPVLENLPGPVLGEINWNADLNDYAATMVVDLSHFGLIG